MDLEDVNDSIPRYPDGSVCESVAPRPSTSAGDPNLFAQNLPPPDVDTTSEYGPRRRTRVLTPSPSPAVSPLNPPSASASATVTTDNTFSYPIDELPDHGGQDIGSVSVVPAITSNSTIATQPRLKAAAQRAGSIQLAGMGVQAPDAGLTSVSTVNGGQLKRAHHKTFATDEDDQLEPRVSSSSDTSSPAARNTRHSLRPHISLNRTLPFTAWPPSVPFPAKFHLAGSTRVEWNSSITFLFATNATWHRPSRRPKWWASCRRSAKSSAWTSYSQQPGLSSASRRRDSVTFADQLEGILSHAGMMAIYPSLPLLFSLLCYWKNFCPIGLTTSKM